MNLELFIAFRYLKARRKQAVVSIVTAISVIGVAAGVAALTIALALSTGMREEIQGKILGATSHISLITSDDSGIPGYRALLEKLSRIDGVVGAASSVYGQVFLSGDLRDRGGVMKGIIPEEESRVSDLFRHIVQGDASRLVQPTGLAGREIPGIILGKDLAEQLGVGAGDTVRAATLQGGKLSPFGVLPSVRTFQVVAVFSSGLWDYDSSWAYVPQDTARGLLNVPADRVNALEFKLADIYAAEQVAAQIRSVAGNDYLVKTWIELNRPLFSAMKLEKLAMFVAIGLIVLVASLNIVTTLTLMVMEKNRDIAIVTAMGGTPRTVMTVFMLQGLIIGLIGTALGAALGIGACWILDTYQVIRLAPEVYAIPYVPFRVRAADVAVTCAVAVLISFLATLYPARSASRLDPVEAFRYE